MELNKKLAVEWITAFNEKDIERLLALYDENAIHYSPKLKTRQPQTKGLVLGKKSLGEWWNDAFTRLPGLHYELINLLADEALVFMEYSRTVEGEPPMTVGEILEISQGKIVQSRVFHG